MDGPQFDTLTRGITARLNRRRSLGLLATLSPLGLASYDTGETKKKKKACPPCKKRKKGKCKGTLPDGTACSGGTCQGGNCAAGVPTPSPPPPSPSPPPPPPVVCDAPCPVCQACRGGACVADASSNDKACSGVGKCFAGVCWPPPACKPAGATCEGGGEPCCNNRCIGSPALCEPGWGPDGALCQVGGDCISGRCSGYHCTGASTCLANLYFCTLGVRDANGCPCLKEKGSGFIRAAIQPQQVGFACGDCNTTQDCIDKHGPDAWCAEDNGDLCGCVPGRGFCTLPC